MTKIKIVGVFIFLSSIALTFISNYIYHENKINNNLLDVINNQKAFTQEISKNIFYIYKNKKNNNQISIKQLDDSINKFLNNLHNKNEVLKEIDSLTIKNKSEEIVLLWNQFYLEVQHFRNNSKIITPYSSILLEKCVNDLYKVNINLVIKFNELIHIHNLYFNKTINNYKNLQYTLFAFLVFLLLYLFTQLQSTMEFIQQFRKTSKNIINNSSIKELKPIKIKNSSQELTEASDNFNFLVDKVNSSLNYSSDSIKNSYESLELVENNIEDILTLLYAMDNSDSIDKELTKKEDIIIQSLEELTTSTQKLENLKINLDNLISHHKLKKQN
ncbi:hypothetical protein [Sulfurimonas sp.]|uniref:hypothetical protein n=1 Tax=Sulfurimonas sp. TaxID=2022749 RepID=UPI002AB09305|nr:hypothetical protein [Sulfurimonas sp.]